MTEYDNKEMNLEDEENVVSEETDEQSLDTDNDRKKNLSFSFDKLLSSLNMNRKKRDESGLLDSYPGPEMLTGESSKEDSSLTEDSELEEMIDEATDELDVQTADELETKAIDEQITQPDTENEADNVAGFEEVEGPQLVDSIADIKEETEESLEEVSQAEAESQLELQNMEVLESATEVVSEERSIEEPSTEEAPYSEEEEDLPEVGGQVSVAESEIEEEKIPAEEAKAASEELEPEEEFSYSIYQNSEGGIDYDKLVGETKLMTIDSIYSCKNLPKNLNESVFIIELYGKTLPENLPIEVKRQSVLNILKVGSLDVEVLLQDAYNRIDLLNEVLEDVAQKTEEMNETNIAEIAELNRKIEELRQTMANRAKYQQKQNTSIGYEIQRIVNIVEFINPR